MSTKVFSKALMASEDVQSYVGTCKFGAGSAPFVEAEITDGAFVVLGDLVKDNVYSQTSLEWNTYSATAPAADTATPVVIDIAGVQEGVIGGNAYRIGNKLVDLVATAGTPVRFRRLMSGDKFWLGAGCFESTPTVGKYAKLTASKVTLTAANDAPSGKFGVKILASKDLTVGQSVTEVSAGVYEQLYLCEVL